MQPCQIAALLVQMKNKRESISCLHTVDNNSFNQFGKRVINQTGAELLRNIGLNAAGTKRGPQERKSGLIFKEKLLHIGEQTLFVLIKASVSPEFFGLQLF